MRLRISLMDVEVGTLELTHGDLSVFRFSERYLAMANRPVLGRWYEDRLGPDFMEKRPQSELPPFFQNYLPEKDSLLRTILAREAGVRPNREFALLAHLGRDLPGAIVATPLEPGAAVDDEDADPPAAPAPTDGKLRFSLAGMQLKFSVSREGQLTVPVSGMGGRFIAKLPGAGLKGMPENELWTMQWAAMSGIDTPSTQLVKWREIERLPRGLDLEGDHAFLIERFDRPAAGGRIHQEDFAQITGTPTAWKYGREAKITYASIGRIVRALCGDGDFEQFLRRLVFVVLSGNHDAHLKNWSLVYPDGRRPRLAPAYDLVTGLPYSGMDEQLACRLDTEWEMAAVRPHHFGHLAEKAGLDANRGIQLAEEAASRAREAWSALSTEHPRWFRDPIDRHLSAIHL